MDFTLQRGKDPQLNAHNSQVLIKKPPQPNKAIWISLAFGNMDQCSVQSGHAPL